MKLRGAAGACGLPRAACGALGLLLACGAFGLLLGCGAREDRRMVVARSVYDRYCSECHGTHESGPAPVAGIGFEPADLRQLAGLYGTPLDREQLAAYIDGRHAKATGEGRLMPVWGDRLYPHLPQTVEVDQMRAGTIDLLIEYLDSIQQPVEPK